MSLRITLSGFDGKKVAPGIAAIMRQATFLGTQRIRTAMVLSMQDNKTGKAYMVRHGPNKPYITPLRKGQKLSKSGRSALKMKGKTGRSIKGGRLHIASAPGQAPAVLFGRLIS